MDNILQIAKEYSEKHNFTYEVNSFKKFALWGENVEEESDNWKKFEKHPGVYILSNNEEILYIGKSHTNTGARLFQHFTNEEKMQKIDDNTNVSVLTFDEEERSMVVALESYLIEKYNPILNKTNY